MGFFDDEKEKIKDMEYDPVRKCYVGKDGDEFHSTPYSNGNGYKYDYYNKSPYGNAPHNSTHVKSDNAENWNRTDNWIYVKFLDTFFRDFLIFGRCIFRFIPICLLTG